MHLPFKMSWREEQEGDLKNKRDRKTQKTALEYASEDRCSLVRTGLEGKRGLLLLRGKRDQPEN